MTAYRKLMKYMLAFPGTIDSVSITTATCSRFENQQKSLYHHKCNHGLLHRYLDIKHKLKKSEY